MADLHSPGTPQDPATDETDSAPLRAPRPLSEQLEDGVTGEEAAALSGFGFATSGPLSLQDEHEAPLFHPSGSADLPLVELPRAAVGAGEPGDGELGDADREEGAHGAADEQGLAQQEAQEDEELSLSEASELVGVSARALRDRVQRGSLPARKVTREGRVLSVVQRSDLLAIYGWMVAEGERKRMAEGSGSGRSGAAGGKGSRVPSGMGASRLSPGLDPSEVVARERLEGALADVLAELRLLREEHGRMREQGIREAADQEREITELNERAEILAEEIRALRGQGAAPELPWQILAAVGGLILVVLGLWLHFTIVEGRRVQVYEQLNQTLERTFGPADPSDQ